MEGVEARECVEFEMPPSETSETSPLTVRGMKKKKKERRGAANLMFVSPPLSLLFQKKKRETEEEEEEGREFLGRKEGGGGGKKRRERGKIAGFLDTVEERWRERQKAELTFLHPLPRG